MILRKITFSFMLFPLWTFAQQDSTFIPADSSAGIKSPDSLIAFEDYLIEGSYMLLKDFQLRLVNNLTTQHETYNASMNRIDSETRNTASNFSLQGWFKVKGNVNVGIYANLKTFITGSNDSPALDVFKFNNDSSAKTVFRNVVPVIKILLHNRKFRLTYQSAFTVPVSKAFTLAYNQNTFRDQNYAQWVNQLFYLKNYSPYFSLKLELFSVIRLGQVEGTNGFTLRMPVTPVFNYNFSSDFRMQLFTELDPVIVSGFFSGFNFREGAGLTFFLNNTVAFDLLFTYVALGKKTTAQSSTVFGTRISF